MTKQRLIETGGLMAGLLAECTGAEAAPGLLARLAAGAERVCGRVKFLARLKTYQESLPQDGRIDKADIGTAADVRRADSSGNGHGG